METTNTEKQDLKCQYCGKLCKSPLGKASHERACSKTEQTKEPEKPIEVSKALTSEEAAIASRVAGEDIDWFTIREDEIEDFSLMADPLKLPPVAQKLQDEKIYAFRWCSRKPERVDQLCKSQQPPLRWAIVNRSTLPALKDQVDDTLGCVCRLDQMLLFKPWSHHARVQMAKRALADNLDNSGRLESRKQKSTDQYQYMAGREHKINAGDDIHFDEGVFDREMGVTEDTTGLGDLVVDE